MLANINADYFARGICDFDDSEVLQCRPYGRCEILYRRSLNAKVLMPRFLNVQTDSNRICAGHFVTSQYKLMLVNVYMPFENTEVESDEYIFPTGANKRINGQIPGLTGYTWWGLEC